MNGPITAVLLAGDRPEGDPLARHFGVERKALIPLAGTPMVIRTATALLAHPRIARVLVVAQRTEALQAALGDDPKLIFSPSRTSIGETIAHLVEEIGTPLLATTADHPLLDGAMLDEFFDKAEGDLSIGLVARETLLAAYPGNRRTWLRFRDGAFSGANLFLLGSDRIGPLITVWRRAEQRRKKVRAIAAAFGPVLLIGTALRLLSLRGTLNRIGRRFGLAIKPVILSAAEACIDVDSVADHGLVSDILARRGA